MMTELPGNKHPNTIKLIRIETEAVHRGWYTHNPGKCFTTEVAKRSGELGNEYPSDNAIKIAEQMLQRLEHSREVKQNKR